MPSYLARNRQLGTKVPFAVYEARVYDKFAKVNRSLTKVTPVGVWDGVDQGFSIMTDQLSSRDVDGDLPQNRVDHIPIRYRYGRPSPFGGFYESNSFVGTSYFLFNAPVALWEGPGVISSRHDRYVPPLSSGEIREFGLKALAAMSQQFPEKVSIANFMMELKDLPDMCLDLIGKMMNFVKSFPRFGGSAPPRVTVESLSGDYLAWNFGWAPLVGDLNTIVNTMNIVDQRLEHLKATRGKWVKTGFSMKIQKDESVLPQVLGTFQGSLTGDEIRLVREGSDYRLRAGARVFNDLDYLDSFQGKLRALIGTWGLTNPLKVIWNAIPFSFIIDWLFDVSGFLASHAVIQDQSADWKLDRYSYSITNTTSIRVEGRQNGSSFKTIHRYNVERYYREPGLPDSLMDFTPTSPQQTALLAALISGKKA